MSLRPSELPPPGATDVLYIVDISGYVFRSYHALDPLSSPSGEPTHATYGTLNMLNKLLRERKPTHLGVAMEGGRNLRTEIDVRYKATRPPAPPDLAIQMQRTRELVEAYRIPTLFAEGYEADDVIAAITQQAKRAGMRVVISSANEQTPGQADSIAKLKAAGVPLRGVVTPYIHAKAIVVDCVAGVCKRAFIGSENFSAGSLGYNRELGVIFDQAPEIAKVKTAIDHDFAIGTPQ